MSTRLVFYNFITKYTDFFLTIERSFCTAKAHIFSTKNIGLFEKLTSENLTKR